MTTKHTPGPWTSDYAGFGRDQWDEIADKSIVSIVRINGNLHPVCIMADHDDIDKANANLIAAAPDMYETLEWLVEYYDIHEDLTSLLEEIGKKDGKIRAAIAKAKGE